MKKIMSLILSLLLLTSTGLAAAAAPEPPDGTLDERMKATTIKVKDTLGIGDEFTSFDGTLNEYGGVSLWELNWSNDKESIYVTANENGRIIRYSDYISDVSRPVYGNIPRFPKISIDEARSAAAVFLDKVLDTSLETVELHGKGTLDYSNNASFYLSGTLKLNGVETPIRVSVSVNSSTKKITSFYRSDYGQEYGGAAKPSAATDKAAAADALKSTLNMKLIYALPGDGSHTARLQYMPNPDGSYVVDAVTGRLLDLSKLDWSDSNFERADAEVGASPSAEPDKAGLTLVEQAAADKLQGVLSQSELENTVRSYPELGLTSDFVVRYLNYYTYEDENKLAQVTASMEFSSTLKDEATQYRNITMDAKTGKFLSLSSNRYYIEKYSAETVAYKYTEQQAEATARAFAGKILPDELKQTVLQTESASPQDGTYSFMFKRAYDSISFPENYIHVGVDADTGFVVSFYSNWYKFEVSFVSSAGAISADTAADKFSAAAGAALRYVNVPEATHASGLLLAYTAKETAVWGIDAISGEPLKAEETKDDILQYSDIDGNPYASIITRLAAYGVGFPGGSFKPNAQLTQEDALIIILSAAGRKAVPLSADRDGDNEELYSAAYSMGILTSAEKDPDKYVTRAEFVKYLVNALGYKEVAQLTGIFKPGFKDDKTIPAGFTGYVAIARGLGIINGDQNGMFKPNDISNRVMAAIMLSNCLSRK